jgi:hypothetical protein
MCRTYRVEGTRILPPVQDQTQQSIVPNSRAVISACNSRSKSGCLSSNRIGDGRHRLYLSALIAGKRILSTTGKLGGLLLG